MSYDDLSALEHAPEAERALLGAILVAPHYATEVFKVVTPQMFVSPKHEHLASLLSQMVSRGSAIDPQLVLTEASTSGNLSRIGGAVYLADLFGQAWAAEHAIRHAEAIRAAWIRRTFSVDQRRLLEMARRPGIELSELLVEAAAISDKYSDLVSTFLVEDRPQTLLELMGLDFGPHVCLIPDLLWQRNRYVFTGAEGAGKTQLSTQLALCSAAGLHPFGGEDFKPLRVLVVDAENDSRQTQFRYRSLMPIVEKLAPVRVDWGNVCVENRVEGLSLLKPENVVWLQRMVEAHRPDVLFIGSFYKLHIGANMNEETSAMTVLAVLDELRARYGCALVIEAHMGHGMDPGGRRRATPRGSSAVVGWSDFGHSYQRSLDDPGREHVHLLDVLRYRGDREPYAQWPLQVRRGEHDELSWVPATDREVQAFRRERDAMRPPDGWTR